MLKNHWFVMAVVLLHTLFFGAALHFGNIYNGDSFEYIYEAVNIMQDGFFYSGNPAMEIEEEYKTLRTPGYPFIIGGVYIFSINNYIVLFLQNLVSVFNILYARQKFLSKNFRNQYDGWLLLLLLFFPSQFIYANIMAPDIWLQTCVLIYFYHCLCFLKKRTTQQIVWMSLALIAGLFIKPVLYPFALIHFLFIAILLFAYHRKLFFKGVALALLPLLAVAMYSYQNFLRTGKYHFSSIQSFNAMYYYHHFIEDRHGSETAEAFILDERKKIAQYENFAQRYDAAQERGVALLKENALPYLAFHLKKSGSFFLETGRGELEEFTGKISLRDVYAGTTRRFSEVWKEKDLEGVIQYVFKNPVLIFAIGSFLMNCIKLVGLLLFFWKTPVHQLLKWFIALFILYFAFITGPISNAHYVLPVSIIMSCCALTGYFYTFRGKLIFN